MLRRQRIRTILELKSILINLSISRNGAVKSKPRAYAAISKKDIDLLDVTSKEISDNPRSI